MANKVSKEDKKFLKILEKAMENGYRKCYIAKNDVSLMFKDGIYFNKSGIYKYNNYKFNKVCDFSEENLKKVEQGKPIVEKEK